MKISIKSQLKWAAASQLLRIFFQLISIIFLARLLAPSDYGLMAMVGTVITFATLFRDLGTGVALIQNKEVTNDLSQAVFLLNIFLGASLTIVLCALALPISYFFSEPKIISILLILSPIFLITSFSIVHYALLERSYSYRKIVFIEFISGAIGLATGILSAISDLGVYSLVSQTIVSTLASTLLACLLSEWSASVKINLTEIRSIWKFSFNNFIFGLVNYFHRNSDAILIGRILGPVELGFYSTAYKILLIPLSNITAVINRASFAVYSRQQDNISSIGDHYKKILFIIGLVSAPMMGVIWALREPLITIILGEKWIKSAELLIWLAPVGYIQAMVSTSGTIFNSIGRSDLLRNMGLIGTPIFILAFFVGTIWGINGVAAAYFFANVIWMPPVLIVVFNQIKIPITKLVDLFTIPLIVGLSTAFLIRLLLIDSNWAISRDLKFWA